MKPVFANYFMSTVNPNGECVLNVFHSYPIATTDDLNKAGIQQGVHNSEMVASIVMTHADAKLLADVLNTTLSKLNPPESNKSMSNIGGH